MARKKGDRNADYDAARAALVVRLSAFISTAEGTRAGLRALAEAADISMATLRHYFGDRAGVFTAVMTWFGEQGAMYLGQAAVPSGPFPASIHELCSFILVGFRMPSLIGMHSAGLSEGPQNPAIAIAYLQHVLDPTIAAVELRLKAHMALGDMRSVDARVAAMGLVSPLYLACLHQGPLCGTQTRPLDLDKFTFMHAEAFVFAYGVK